MGELNDGEGLMTVLHISDIAGTSSSVIDVARRHGLDWQLHAIPPGRGGNHVAMVVRRIWDFTKVRTIRPQPEVLHVNYGVSGYYGWFFSGLFVLHLHGTDIRQDFHSAILGPVVRRSILKADVVLYSTPDMEAAVRAVRPDAIWLPAALNPEAEELLSPQRREVFRSIFFASRWDDIKGAQEQLKLVHWLRTEHPELELVGLDWGQRRSEAAATGMTLLPHMDASTFRKTMSDADVVVGQLQLGALGITDLEAMVQSRPVIAFYDLARWYGSEAPIFNTRDSSPREQICLILDDLEAAESRAREGRAWALEHHSGASIQRKLDDIYGQANGT